MRRQQYRPSGHIIKHAFSHTRVLANLVDRAARCAEMQLSSLPPVSCVSLARPILSHAHLMRASFSYVCLLRASFSLMRVACALHSVIRLMRASFFYACLMRASFPLMRLLRLFLSHARLILSHVCLLRASFPLMRLLRALFLLMQVSCVKLAQHRQLRVRTWSNPGGT